VIGSVRRPPRRRARLRRLPLEIGPTPYPALKDPCPVLLADGWHLFATGCRRDGGWDVLHAVAPGLGGPWRLLRPSRVEGVHGDGVCAPGVVADGGRLHLFLQTGFAARGARVEHAVSTDGGATFTRVDTALSAGAGGVYDAQPALVAGRHLLVAARFAEPGAPGLVLAEAPGWAGPWAERPLLDLAEVPWQAQPGERAFEWGLEGPQLLALPDGGVLLVAVGFRRARAGRRQRLLLAVAPTPEGPWEVLPPPLRTAAGENGHATAVVVGARVELLLQERRAGGPWGLSRAELHLPVPGELAGRGR